MRLSRGVDSRCLICVIGKNVSCCWHCPVPWEHNILPNSLRTACQNITKCTSAVALPLPLLILFLHSTLRLRLRHIAHESPIQPLLLSMYRSSNAMPLHRWTSKSCPLLGMLRIPSCWPGVHDVDHPAQRLGMHSIMYKTMRFDSPWQ